MRSYEAWISANYNVQYRDCPKSSEGLTVIFEYYLRHPIVSAVDRTNSRIQTGSKRVGPFDSAVRRPSSSAAVRPGRTRF